MQSVLELAQPMPSMSLLLPSLAACAQHPAGVSPCPTLYADAEPVRQNDVSKSAL